MNECKFCAYKPLELTKTTVYVCSDQVPAPSPTHMLITTPTPADMKHDTRFTPGARLSLNPEQVHQMLTHQQAWRQFLTTKAEHAIVLEQPQQLQKFESAEPPKDWDVLMMSATDYALTRRAATILIISAHQIHDRLPLYIQSHPLLKVINIR